MDCIPVPMLTQVLSHAMKAAGVPAATQQRVLQAADDLSYSDGAVQAIRTEPPKVEVFVAGVGGGDRGAMRRFSFPPNPATFVDEFKRAQNEDRTVSVVFTSIAGVNQIVDLWVYAGEADPRSNKRKA